jgi:hypothetical protein
MWRSISLSSINGESEMAIINIANHIGVILAQRIEAENWRKAYRRNEILA